jgi:hypothetical protein
MGNRIFDRGYATARAAVVLGFSMLAMAGCGDIHSRGEFTTLVTDKSEEEVVKNVGKPASVDASNPARVTWTYKTASYDIARQNARDDKTVVVFAPNPATGKLKAVEVKFN